MISKAEVAIELEISRVGRTGVVIRRERSNSEQFLSPDPFLAGFAGRGTFEIRAFPVRAPAPCK
jgi:hypothetical protein